jgi:hypothetical protein
MMMIIVAWVKIKSKTIFIFVFEFVFKSVLKMYFI